MHNDADFTSNDMCCACGGGRRDYVFYMYDSYGDGWTGAEDCDELDASVK